MLTSLDWTSFTTESQRLGLLGYLATHKGATKRGAIRRFKAKALTDAVPLNLADLKNYATSASGPNKVARYILRARILQTDLYEYNPHAYLKDPCDPGFAGDVNEAMKLIMLHTTCITPRNFAFEDNEIIHRGDEIEMTCKVNKEGIVDVQFATVTRIVSRAIPGSPLQTGCVGLKGKFAADIVPLERFSLTPDGPPPSGWAPSDGKCTTESAPGTVDFSKVEATPPINSRQMDWFGNDNVRYQQPTLGELKWFVDTKEITTVVKLNGSGKTDLKKSKDPKTGACIGEKLEEEYVKHLGATYVRLSAHDDFSCGRGYRESKTKTYDELQKGHVLIHCTAGADRTGFTVANWIMKTDKVITGNAAKYNRKSRESMYDYTLKYNSWESLVAGNRACNNVGYAKYLDGFYPMEDWCKKDKRKNMPICECFPKRLKCKW